MSVPELGNEGSRAISITPIKQLNEQRLLRSAGSRYLLVSDIAQFFPSIYTHAIAWAVEGKEKAKTKAARRDKALLGNRLDELTRYTQQNQTVGIPIGPDTSHVIAELVGTAIDVELRKKLGYWPRGYRHVDDFCFCFDTENDAVHAYAKLAEALSTFELKVNIQKTKIVRATDFHYDSWVHQFDSFEFAQEKARQRRDLHRFFDMAFSLAQRFDDENVMQYALRRVETEIIKAKNWDVFAAYLMRCMDAYPNTIPGCVAIIDTYHRYLRADAFVAGSWETFVSAQVAQHAPVERHSEVAWLLWLALRVGVKVGRSAVRAMGSMQSSICLILALALESRGQLLVRLARNKLPRHNQPTDLFGPHWLLMYEGAAQGWLKAAEDPVRGDRYFKELIDNKVHFFDAAREPLPIFALKQTAGTSAGNVEDLLDMDESLYGYFEFSDADEDYLGRRAGESVDDDTDDGNEEIEF